MRLPMRVASVSLNGVQLVLRDIQTNLCKAVPSGESTVGREDFNPIQIDEASVSRSHAKVHNTDDGFFLEDLGSSNGTAVGGTIIGKSKVPVEIGSVIYFGNTAYKLERGKTTEASAGVTVPKGLKPVKHSRIDLRRATELIDLEKVHEEVRKGPRPGAMAASGPPQANVPQARLSNPGLTNTQAVPTPASSLAEPKQLLEAKSLPQTPPPGPPTPFSEPEPEPAAPTYVASENRPRQTDVTPPTPSQYSREISTQPEGVFSPANKGTMVLLITVALLAGIVIGIIIGFVLAQSMG